MAAQKDVTVTEELENRLDHFFGEEEESLDFTKIEDDSKASTLHELKSLLLSIDWEITDEIMIRLIDLITEMENAYRDDKDLHVYLQILGSIGKYIKVNKVKSHPDALKLMNSVYSAMEKVNLGKDLPDGEKEKVLLEEVQRFKKLKNQIAVTRLKRKINKKGEASEPGITPTKKEKAFMPFHKESGLSQNDKERSPHEAVKGPMTPHEAFVYALEEIRELIRGEFRALRAEVKLWRESMEKNNQ